MASIARELPATATQAEVEAVVDELNADPACTAFLVQQPTGLDEFALLSRVDPAKDVDGLHPTNLGALVLGEPAPLPCTPTGIVELLRRYDVPIAGAEVVVIGRGITVGRPLGLLLTRRSENATVTLCHTGTRDLAAHVRRADIVVAAAGVPGIVTADMVKPGAAVLDVGVSRVQGADGAAIAGDVAADVAEVAGWVTPNPGGVGPMTRAMLLANVVEAAERALAAPMTSPRLGVWWVVAVGLGVGLLLVLLGSLRSGGYVAAAALVVGGLLRLLLPQSRAGGLAVRRRLTDVVVLLGLGAALFLTVRLVDLSPRR